MDGRVRSLRDQFVTHSWSEILYNGMYFSPEREFVENSLIFSQRRVVCIIVSLRHAPSFILIKRCTERQGGCSLLPRQLLHHGSLVRDGEALLRD